MQAHGPIPGRAGDAAGLMASYVRFTDEPRAGFGDDYELAVELFYKLRIMPWRALKPDFQYILNPGGRGLPNASVGTLRWSWRCSVYRAATPAAGVSVFGPS